LGKFKTLEGLVQGNILLQGSGPGYGFDYGLLHTLTINYSFLHPLVNLKTTKPLWALSHAILKRHEWMFL
jgi:hypothetical protein